MRALFLAWQDPQSRRWYPIGRLESSDGLYLFAYTRGAELARLEAHFEPLASFPELHSVYYSERLFPLFTNRLPPTSRPEYRDYLKWLNVPETESDPIAILARNGGLRVTDTLEVFPDPDRNETGEYEIHFLVGGLNYLPMASADRASQLEPGQPLLVMHDPQNPVDADAIMLRTAGVSDRDVYPIGYCPRYLRSELMRAQSPHVTVERVNRPPAPSQFRVLCKAVLKMADGIAPFSGPEYQPIVAVPGALRSFLREPLQRV